MMNKLSKILLWLIGSVVSLLLIVALAAYLFFPLDEVKRMALEKGEAFLGRPLQVKAIDLSLWGGVGVKLNEVVIGSPEQFGEEQLVTAEEIDVKLRLWELISGDYVVDRLIIEKPIIKMIVLADGSSNFNFDLKTDQLDSAGLASSEALEKLKEATPQTQAAAAVVAFDRLEISGGQFYYRDESTNRTISGENISLSTQLATPKDNIYRSQGRLSFEKLHLPSGTKNDGTAVALSYTVEYDVTSDRLIIEKAEVTLGQVQFDLSGQLTDLSGASAGQVRIRTAEIAFADLLKSLPEENSEAFSDFSVDGRLLLDASVDWTSANSTSQYNYSGSTELIEISLTAAEVPGELKIGRAMLDFKTDQARLTLERAAFNEQPLKGFLTISDFEEPHLDAELAGSVDLAFVQTFLPERAGESLTGLTKFDLKLSGKLDEPAKMQFAGELAVDNGTFISPLLPEPIEAFELALSVSSESIRLDRMKLQFVSSDIAFAGRINDPFPYLFPFEGINRSQLTRPQAELTISSTRLDIDRLFPEAVPGSRAVVTIGGEIVIDSTQPIMPLPNIDLTGTLTVDTMIYNQVEFTNLRGKLAVVNRKIRCYDVTGNMYSGAVSGETTVDLSDFSNPHYVGKFKAEQIEADDFISRFSSHGGHLFGKINLDGSYDAAGWEPEAFKKSLSMNSVGTLDEGKLITSGATNKLLSQLAEQTGESFDQEQTLKKLWTNIRIQNGRVYLDEFQTVLGNIGDVTLSGSYGFDETLDYGASILLSEAMTARLVRKNNLAKFLASNDSKRISLPVLIGGTSQKPTVTIDMTALQSQALDNLKDNAKDLLKGLFN